jgi:hypothetical protein
MNKDCGEIEAIWEHKMRMPQAVITEIKIRRLQWLGYVIIMGNTSIPKTIFNTKPEGRRRVGRPKSRWLDDIEIDTETLGIKIRRLRAQDRKNEQ